MHGVRASSPSAAPSSAPPAGRMPRSTTRHSLAGTVRSGSGLVRPTAGRLAPPATRAARVAMLQHETLDVGELHPTTETSRSVAVSWRWSSPTVTRSLSVPEGARTTWPVGDHDERTGVGQGDGARTPDHRKAGRGLPGCDVCCSPVPSPGSGCRPAPEPAGRGGPDQGCDRAGMARVGSLVDTSGGTPDPLTTPCPERGCGRGSTRLPATRAPPAGGLGSPRSA